MRCLEVCSPAPLVSRYYWCPQLGTRAGDTAYLSTRHGTVTNLRIIGGTAAVEHTHRQHGRRHIRLTIGQLPPDNRAGSKCPWNDRRGVKAPYPKSTLPH